MGRGRDAMGQNTPPSLPTWPYRGSYGAGEGAIGWEGLLWGRNPLPSFRDLKGEVMGLGLDLWGRTLSHPSLCGPIGAVMGLGEGGSAMGQDPPT